MLQNIKPRKYQEVILNTAKKHNTLVVLPTGLGKTLIALMLAIERSNEFPGSKVLFLAPTRPLASQHLNYFQKHLPELYAQLELFTGKVKAEKRKKLWQKADIIFSTPQCIANDLRNKRISLEDVSLLIEDEAHRCLKNYDYVYVASEYRKQAKNVRILGLTASPGSKAGIIKDVCRNLGIEAVEARTRESEDVKPYLQKLEVELVEVELPEEFKRIRGMLQEIFDKRIEELKNRKLLFHPATKKNLLELQHNIMRAISSGNKHFNLLKGASACAQAIKLQHALELLETQGVASLRNYMQSLFKQAEQEKSKAVKQLVKQQKFSQAYVSVNELVASGKEHPKLEKIKAIVEKEIHLNPKSRIIVFSQYRDSVTRICKELNSIEGINARVFIGQARKEEGGLSQKEQQAIINDFKAGLINTLVATSIAEEGLDLPEVNVVIFYEPIPSAIRKIQRAGRTARLMKGKLIILITRKTRDEAYHWAAYHKERKMHGILKDLTENFRKHNDEKEKQKGLGEFV
jgi:Fanconi anemia group M protein